MLQQRNAFMCQVSEAFVCGFQNQIITDLKVNIRCPSVSISSVGPPSNGRLVGIVDELVGEMFDFPRAREGECH
jgi:hypothetical protein